jgi:transposase-like protein
VARAKKYPDELIQRAVRLALEGERPIAHIAHDLGVHRGDAQHTLKCRAPDLPAGCSRSPSAQ